MYYLGYCTVEEGEVSGKEIILESVNVERMTFVRNPEVLKVCRANIYLDGINPAFFRQRGSSGW